MKIDMKLNSIIAQLSKFCYSKLKILCCSIIGKFEYSDKEWLKFWLVCKRRL